jgi:hypothetical protein
MAMAFEVPGGWRQEKTAVIMKVMQVSWKKIIWSSN